MPTFAFHHSRGDNSRTLHTPRGSSFVSLTDRTNVASFVTGQCNRLIQIGLPASPSVVSFRRCGWFAVCFECLDPCVSSVGQKSVTYA